MGFWSDLVKGLIEGSGEQAARGGQLVPSPQGGREIDARNATPPAARDARQRPTAQPPPHSKPELWEDSIAPAAELFRFEVWCSAKGRPFVAVAERHGETLY